MSAETWGMLICLGVVAFVLLGEIRRVHRLLNESIQAHHKAITKIPEMEAQIRILQKQVKARQ